MTTKMHMEWLLFLSAHYYNWVIENWYKFTYEMNEWRELIYWINPQEDLILVLFSLWWENVIHRIQFKYKQRYILILFKIYYDNQKYIWKLMSE